MPRKVNKVYEEGRQYKFTLNLTYEEKMAWVSAAAENGITLTHWVREICDYMADYESKYMKDRKKMRGVKRVVETVYEEEEVRKSRQATSPFRGVGMEGDCTRCARARGSGEHPEAGKTCLLCGSVIPETWVRGVEVGEEEEAREVVVKEEEEAKEEVEEFVEDLEDEDG